MRYEILNCNVKSICLHVGFTLYRRSQNQLVRYPVFITHVVSSFLCLCLTVFFIIFLQLPLIAGIAALQRFQCRAGLAGLAAGDVRDSFKSHARESPPKYSPWLACCVLSDYPFACPRSRYSASRSHCSSRSVVHLLCGELQSMWMC